MPLSAIAELHDAIISTIRKITQGDWKVLVVDENSQKCLENVVKTDDILKENITNIERIEERRDINPETDAIYILSPEPLIVDCLLADFRVGRYRSSFFIWTALPDPAVAQRVKQASPYGHRYTTCFIDFFPRESHLVTFRDPWSFPILFNPACDKLVREHLTKLAQRIMGVCVLLNENPRVRYYSPRNSAYGAHPLCHHLARLVQEELEEYTRYTPGFGDGTGRPQGVLVITDRTMDLMAPLLHEFTYQAMAHDLLPIRESDKVRYRLAINEGRPDAEDKEMELHDGDRVWVENRHRHMKDTIDKIMADFNKFIEANPHFAKMSSGAGKTSLNTIKDMVAGLPQFQTQKEAYSLHISMAQECMNAFQRRKLPDVAGLEQTLATGLDEDGRKPKNPLVDIVPLLDDPAILPQDRMRLIVMYVMYREGIILDDIKRLLAHSQLPEHSADAIKNLALLGARPTCSLKEPSPPGQDQPPLFPRSAPKQVSDGEDDGTALSRYKTAMQGMLDSICSGTLDQKDFPYVKPPADPNEDLVAAQSGSLRSNKPVWANTNRKAPENRQRIIVFMTGGATYSESRECYNASAKHNRDVVLVTSHMNTPQLFLRMLADLSLEARQLGLPMLQRPPTPPVLLEPPPQQRQPPPPQLHPSPQGRGNSGQPTGLPPVSHSQQPNPGGRPPAGRGPTPSPPVNQMANMNIGRTPPASSGSSNGGGKPGPAPPEDKKSKLRFLGVKKSKS